jgi:nucleotidyltransferase/DNA polymerase involved in DNA repair
MRIACVLLPRFPLAIELLLRPELRGLPAVLGGAPEERKLVVECSPEAERRGVRRDMSLREALVRCREAVFLEARPRMYIAAFEQMLNALEQISPVVEEGTPGCAFVDLTGLPGVDEPSGERRLADALQRATKASVQLTPRVGIADTRFAAWVAAVTPQRSERRCHTPNAAHAADTRVRVVGSAETVAFLSSLPVHRLPVSEEMRKRLRLLGIQAASELAALPRATLAAQFGPEGSYAWDLLFGAGGRPLVPRRHTPDVSAVMEFPQPVIEAPAILAAARHLLGRLFTRPECAGRAVRAVELSAVLGSGDHWRRAATFREPTSDQERMLRALAAKIEGAAFPSAIEALELRLRDLCAEAGSQGSLFSARTRHLHNLAAALEQLHARFGKPLVMQIVGVEPWSRIPERQYALIACEPSTILGR